MINNIIKTELYKLYKSKSYLVNLILLTGFFVLSFILTYCVKETRPTYEVYLLYIYAVNTSCLFPFAIVMVFASIVTDEFSNGTIKILSGSVFSKIEIFIGKFVVACISFFSSFILLLFIYFIFLTVFYKINSSQMFMVFNQTEVIKRFIIVSFTQVIYLICFASFVYLISWIIKKKSLLIIICLAVTIAANSLPPLPYGIGDYIFLKNSTIYTMFVRDTFNYFTVLKNICVNISTMSLFFIVGVLIIHKKELY